MHGPAVVGRVARRDRREQSLGLGQDDDQEARRRAERAMPTGRACAVPSNAWPMAKPSDRRAERADHALDRRGGAGDRRHMLHRQRAEVGRGEGEARHRQPLEDDEQSQAFHSRRARSPRGPPSRRRSATAPAWPTRRRPKRPTMRELSQDASAIGAAIAANTRPISCGAPNASNTICWIEAM